MIDFQTHFVFPVQAVPAAGPLPANAERWAIKTPDKAVLQGIHLAPEAPSGRVILGFGGNAWNGQDVAEYLQGVFPDDDIVAFHYRGYHPSTGTPSATALVADAPLIYDEAVRRLKPRRIYAAGFSIGSGIACTLATARKLDGLFLVTPFDSLKGVAQSFYPWLPIAAFFSHEIDAAGAIAKVRTPVAILAGSSDEIVPPARTEALAKRTPNLVFNRTIAHASHNGIYGRSDFQLAMREALAALEKG